MRTHVEFRSSVFPREPGGKAVAELLHVRLAERGMRGDPIYAEDWGWVVPVDNVAFPLWVGCSNLDGEPDGFLCFIEPSKPTVRRMFRSIDTRERVEQVAAAIDEILPSHPGVREMRWRREE